MGIKAAEQSGSEVVCKTNLTGSIPAVASKIRHLYSKLKMRKVIKYPAWQDMKGLPDNLTILRRDTFDELYLLIERQYYFGDKKGWHDALRASASMKMQHDELKLRIAELGKENARLKRMKCGQVDKQHK